MASSQRSTAGLQGRRESRYPGSHRSSTSVPSTALFALCRPRRVTARVCGVAGNGGQCASSASVSSFSKSEKVQQHQPSAHTTSGILRLMHSTHCTHALCRRCVSSMVFHHALICQDYFQFLPCTSQKPQAAR